MLFSREIIALNSKGYKVKTSGDNGKVVIRYVCVICGEDLGRSPDLTRHYYKHIERDRIAVQRDDFTCFFHGEIIALNNKGGV